MSEQQAQQLFKQGQQLLESGQPQQSIPYFQQSIKLAPNHIEPYCLLGVACHRLGQLEIAFKLLQSAAVKAPNSPFTHFYLGHFYHSQGNFQNAVDHYQQAVSQAPRYLEALHHLSGALIKLRRFPEAFETLEKILIIKPSPGAYNNLGLNLAVTGNLELGYKYLLEGYEKFPDNEILVSNTLRTGMKICDWDKTPSLEQTLDKLTQKKLKANQPPEENPFITLTRNQDPEFNFRLAVAHSQLVSHQPLTHLTPSPTSKSTKIRLGYLSYDFNSHVIGYHVMGLFKHHNRDRFVVNAYSYGPDDNSLYRNFIQDHADNFRDISNQDFLKAAQTIQQDNVDILVDLTTYTIGSRIQIPMHRPAPIQVNYLGLPGTTGNPIYHYTITDPILSPPSHIPYYSESLVYLPKGYQIASYDTLNPPPPPSRGQMNLPKNAFIFASFNQSYKLTHTTLTLWLKLLQTLPQSVLWLGPFDPPTIDNIKTFAKKQHIKLHRLIFAPNLPFKQHLARLHLADLCLDTPNYNGGSTTSNALFAGVPVITTQGTHYPSRMSTSFLSHLGLSELITPNKDSYLNLAQNLATHPKKLALIRRKLNTYSRSHPLFNSSLLTHHLESAYTTMWHRHLHHLPPTSFHVIDNQPLDSSYS